MLEGISLGTEVGFLETLSRLTSGTASTEWRTSSMRSTPWAQTSSRPRWAVSHRTFLKLRLCCSGKVSNFLWPFKSLLPQLCRIIEHTSGSTTFRKSASRFALALVPRISSLVTLCNLFIVRIISFGNPSYYKLRPVLASYKRLLI